MKTSFLHFGSVIAMAVALSAAGCGGPDGFGEDIETTESAYSYTGTYYDGDGVPPTQCTVGGINMHCCPNGYAMVGARLDYNVFKCSKPNGGFVGSRFLSRYRSGEPICATYSAPALMVGYNQSFNRALCQAPGIPARGFQFDTGTQDGWPMQVCPTGNFMTGIAWNGWFQCAY